MRVTKRNAQTIADELQMLHDRAEALADTLDPGRTFGAADETTRSVVRAADIVVRQTSDALAMLRTKFGADVVA